MKNKKLTLRLTQDIPSLRKEGAYTPTDNESGYTFIDNNANILAVGHLDFIAPYKSRKVWDKKLKKMVGIEIEDKDKRTPVEIWKDKKGDINVKSISLDDRLGVHILLDIFPLLGIKADILLTENEECGQSTAKAFKTEKKYNWIIEFDRRGFDVVMYGYETQEMKDLLASYNLTTGFGSYSDICELSHLGATGFNFGTGYFQAHTMNCTANLTDVAYQLETFRQFYEDNKNARFEYDPLDYIDYRTVMHQNTYNWYDKNNWYGKDKYGTDGYGYGYGYSNYSKLPEIEEDTEITDLEIDDLDSYNLCYCCCGVITDFDIKMGDCGWCGSPIVFEFEEKCWGCGEDLKEQELEKYEGLCLDCWRELSRDEVVYTYSRRNK